MALPEYEDRMAVLLAENARLREALEEAEKALLLVQEREGGHFMSGFHAQLDMALLKVRAALAPRRGRVIAASAEGPPAGSKYPPVDR